MTLFDIFMLPIFSLYVKIVSMPLPRTKRECPYEWIIDYYGTAKISYGIVYKHRDFARPDGNTPVFLFDISRIRVSWVDAGGSTQEVLKTYHLAFDGDGYFLWDQEWGGVMLETPPLLWIYEDWHKEVLAILRKTY